MSPGLGGRRRPLRPRRPGPRVVLPVRGDPRAGVSSAPRLGRPLVVAVFIAVSALVACCGRQHPSGRAPRRPDPRARPPPPPHVTLVALSDWQGVLKPCGCTVALRRGGIERIARHLQELRRRDDSVLFVHAGALLTEDRPPSEDTRAQRRLRVAAFARALERLDLAAVALSGRDVARGGAEAQRLLREGSWPVLAAGWQGGVDRARPTRLLATASGLRVGLTAVDPRSARDRAGRHAVVAAQIAGLRARGAQVTVVLSDLGMRGSRKLARAVPGIDVIVVGDVPARSELPEELERDGEGGRTLMLRTPRHGAWLSRLTLTLNGTGRWQDVSERLPGALAGLRAREERQRADLARLRPGSVARAARERRLAETRRQIARALAARGEPLPPGRLAAWQAVDLPWSVTPDGEMAALVARYDRAAGALSVKAVALPRPPLPGRPFFVGEARCLGCHAAAERFAKRNPHARAWAALTAAGKGRDLDCVPCHVTGFREPGGSAFDNLERFLNPQCEACHGPGSEHVAADGEGGGVARVPPASACRACHTDEHSPRFDDKVYRDRLRVPGHGLAEGQER